MANTLRRSPGLMRGRSEAKDPDEDAVANAVLDSRAFAVLYKRYVDLVYRYCLRRLGSREEAEDATSLIFMKALSAMPAYQPNGPSFRAWLFTIAHNTVADEWRHRHQRMAVTDDLDLIDPAPTPERVVMDDEAGRAVRALLARLSLDQADVVELRLAGLRGPEIAQVLGRSPNTVKVTQHRAYTRLRSLLVGKEAGDAIG
jgi:RNA polymerase sigma-70 factor (ECF subfamily)